MARFGDLSNEDKIKKIILYEYQFTFVPNISHYTNLYYE